MRIGRRLGSKSVVFFLTARKRLRPPKRLYIGLQSIGPGDLPGFHGFVCPCVVTLVAHGEQQPFTVGADIDQSVDDIAQHFGVRERGYIFRLGLSPIEHRTPFALGDGAADGLTRCRGLPAVALRLVIFAQLIDRLE